MFFDYFSGVLAILLLATVLRVILREHARVGLPGVLVRITIDLHDARVSLTVGLMVIEEVHTLFALLNADRGLLDLRLRLYELSIVTLLLAEALCLLPLTLVGILGSIKARNRVLSERALLRPIEHEANHGSVADGVEAFLGLIRVSIRYKLLQLFEVKVDWVLGHARLQ